ncbi:S9 family peptidase [Sphingosinicella ginsenosidimutans]|uniref:S9 family peptidase n=1 Tax=Allosphingosinicella ginsenosidimutans TaxID=1176539 RepID=A0A5C6TU96_9SPHN|nr:S9 family peptidase [Sphingosinicella ginsenosidimutans]TXC63258.1 S9 family peptidase [Sphingosinicella ginsenosidimutans]
MKKAILACALALAWPASLAAAPATGPDTRFTTRDLFDLEAAGDPEISPDGRWIAYVRHSGDIMTDRYRPTIWLVDTQSGRQVPIAAGPGTASQPRWSPTGDRLAYVATPEGGQPQLYVRWMANGETARITGLPEAPSAIAWSPDGRQIAYSMFVPDDAPRLGAPQPRPEGARWADDLQVIDTVVYRFDGGGYLHAGYDQIFVVSADGGAPRQISYGPYNDGGPLSWTPDGRTILFSANRHENWQRDAANSEVYALDVATSRITPLTSRNGPDGEPAASPDGRLIAYTGYDDHERSYENNLLYVMNADGSGARALTASLDRSVSNPVWAADGRSIYVQYDDRGRTKVARVGLDGSIRDVATGLTGTEFDRPYTGGSFSVARDGTVAISAGDGNRPPDVAVVRGGNVRRLTSLNSELFAARRLGEVRHIDVASSVDQRPIDAWLTLPPDYVAGRRYPLILEIHGGPFSAYGPSFSTDDQLYAAAGYVVLSTNPRGSTSYGAEFANLIHHAYPGQDYDDLMSAVDAAIAQGFADPDHLYVTGGSGGGVLTAWIVGKTNRFRAAASQKPVIDWASFVLTSDFTPFFSRYWFGHYPWEDPQGYWARSPLSLAGNIQTPTLVVVGTEDHRTPPSEAEQLYTALQLRGVPTTLVRVPGASHGGLAARPSQSGAKANAILEWFHRYHEGAPRPATPTPAQ